MSIDPASALMAMDAAASDTLPEPAPGALSPIEEGARSPASQPVSQTALDFIGSQEALEAEAREALPYSFDICTNDMGPLRQNLYACLTCNPPPTPESPDTDSYKPAGVCYACSISCHGEHELVELFTRRNFVCDCGTTRLPATASCTLRVDPATEQKGVRSQQPASTNTYNKNFRNLFCSCNELYDPQKQKGTMFQCIGLATEEEGGCGEDWFHPECLMGLPRDWYKKMKDDQDMGGVTKDESDQAQPDQAAGDGDAPRDEHPVPPGFPEEEEFDHLVCSKCVEKAPFLKQYASHMGFIPLTKAQPESGDSKSSQEACSESTMTDTQLSKKRGRDEEEEQADNTAPALKKAKSEAGGTPAPGEGETTISACKLTDLPPAPIGTMSLLLPENFREKLSRCKDHYIELRPFPMLLEEEETYEPPISEDGRDGAGSAGRGSLLEMGEDALGNIDRVRAIEGVMAYNHIKDKVKDFLKPFADSGKLVSAEEIKAYFEKLRGDHEAIREARARKEENDGGDDGHDGDSRREQGGY